MKKANKRVWTPSVMLKRPDNIVSSEYSNTSNRFVPSYEKEEVNMYWLMAMEYSRIWHEEKSQIKKVVLAAVDNDFLVRRYVKRGLLLKKKEEEQKTPFKMKRFQNIPSKIKIRTKEEIDSMMAKLTDKEKEELMAEAKIGLKKKKAGDGQENKENPRQENQQQHNEQKCQLENQDRIPQVNQEQPSGQQAEKNK